MSEIAQQVIEYNRIVKHSSAKDAEIPPDYRERAAFCVSVLLEPLRELAKEHGYALFTHGSLVRDIDICCVPWKQIVSHPVVLADAIREKAEELCGHAIKNPREQSYYFLAGCPGGKPQGRLCWTFHLGGGPYIDLSIFPPSE